MEPKNFIILIAEDSENDALLLRRALQRAKIENPVQIVSDGQQVIDYMEGKGIYADRVAHPLPALLILDIKMPKVTGLEVLRWVCNHPEFKVVPTVIFSSSKQEYDICKAFELGAHGYFVKPVNLEETERIFRAIREYWNISSKPQPSLCQKILSPERGVEPSSM